jgi:nucleoside-diphosphate-sugar epimerase
VSLPASIASVELLDELQSEPVPGLVDFMRRLPGDLLVLGAGGKMGPTLARLARRASDEAGIAKRVIAVSRWSDPGARALLEACGVETLEADLLDRSQLAALPEVPNVVFLAGRKFGSTGNEALTWAMNVLLPAMVAERYAASRIVALSTGNVYPLTPAQGRGCTEDDAPAPLGEYAQSCLGRERMMQYAAATRGTASAIIRLNYAIDLRYGVLLDLAQRVHEGREVPLATGCVNVIWQRDANAAVLLALEHCAVPPVVLNVTGPDVLSVRALATRLGELLGRVPIFEGEESGTALLSDASRFHALMPFDKVDVDTLLRLTADWVLHNRPVWNKPTHFETRDGKY